MPAQVALHTVLAIGLGWALGYGIAELITDSKKIRLWTGFGFGLVAYMIAFIAMRGPIH